MTVFLKMSTTKSIRLNFHDTFLLGFLFLFCCTGGQNLDRNAGGWGESQFHEVSPLNCPSPQNSLEIKSSLELRFIRSRCSMHWPSLSPIDLPLSFFPLSFYCIIIKTSFASLKFLSPFYNWTYLSKTNPKSYEFLSLCQLGSVLHAFSRAAPYYWNPLWSQCPCLQSLFIHIPP